MLLELRPTSAIAGDIISKVVDGCLKQLDSVGQSHPSRYPSPLITYAILLFTYFDAVMIWLSRNLDADSIRIDDILAYATHHRVARNPQPRLHPIPDSTRIPLQLAAIHYDNTPQPSYFATSPHKKACGTSYRHRIRHGKQRDHQGY